MNRKIVYVLSALGILYIALGLPYIYSMSNSIGKDYFQQVGKGALVAVSSAARHLSITNEDIKRLASLDYSQLPYDPLNIALEHDIKKSAELLNARYAYLMRVLDKPKYRITSDDVDYYKAPEDTPLNVVWLLDVNFGEGNSTNLDFLDEYKNDKDRYSYLRDSDVKPYANREEVFLYSNDEFGVKYITAYCPLYTKEGDFAGMLGLDIFAVGYLNFMRLTNIVIVSGGVMIFLLIMVASAIYIRNKRSNQLLTIVSERIALDPLTGIYNRNGLERFEKDKYELLKATGNPITVIMIDIDKFKDVNDTYGHDIGDEVLISVAKTLRENVRMPDDYPIRLGGDEFLVIFTNIDQERVIAVATRLNKVIANRKHSHKALLISVSIGISTTTLFDDGKLLTDLQKEADEALYAAKRRGRNNVTVHTPSGQANGRSNADSVKPQERVTKGS